MDTEPIRTGRDTTETKIGQKNRPFWRAKTSNSVKRCMITVIGQVHGQIPGTMGSVQHGSRRTGMPPPTCRLVPCTENVRKITCMPTDPSKKICQPHR